MREILFRGKRLDNGEWEEGFYNFCKKRTGENIHFIRPIGLQDAFQVDPAAVGQYTGLQDKNGERIFEGDIVLDCGEPCVIMFENCCWKELYQNDYWSFIYDDSVVEVIGNIHDNPELMNGGTA